MFSLNPSELATYLAVTALLVATPGLATAVVVRNALTAGRAGGFGTALGVACANAGYALLAGAGFAAFLIARPDWILNLRRGGALLLALLGAQSLWRAVRLARSASPSAPEPPAPASVVGRKRRGFLAGFATNALNPSVVVFYATYVPQFALGPSGAGSTAGSFGARFAILSALHVALALAVHSFYALTLGRLGQAMTRPRVRAAMDAVAGVALLLLALSAWR